MYCSTCGTPITARAQFCPTCVADLTRSGALRLTPKMSDAEIVREMPDELVDTVVRPPLVLDETPEPVAASPRTPADPRRAEPLDSAAWSEPAQARRSEVARRRVRAAASRQHTRRNQIAVAVLTMALLAAVIPIVIISWSFFNIGSDIGAIPSPSAPGSVSASGTPTAAASSPVASTAPSKTPVKTPAKTPSVTRLPWPAYARPCGADVAANKQTSCEFANVVLAAVDRKRTGEFKVTAASPVTNRSYTLRCTRPDFIVCTGGNSVRILLQPL